MARCSSTFDCSEQLLSSYPSCGDVGASFTPTTSTQWVFEWFYINYFCNDFHCLSYLFVCDQLKYWIGIVTFISRFVMYDVGEAATIYEGNLRNQVDKQRRVIILFVFVVAVWVLSDVANEVMRGYHV